MEQCCVSYQQAYHQIRHATNSINSSLLFSFSELAVGTRTTYLHDGPQGVIRTCKSVQMWFRLVVVNLLSSPYPYLLDVCSQSLQNSSTRDRREHVASQTVVALWQCYQITKSVDCLPMKDSTEHLVTWKLG